MEFLGNERVLDRTIKLRTVVFRIEVVADATPADKIHRSDLGNELIILRTEGLTTDADDIEDVSGDFTTPVDATDAVFGAILRKELTEDQFDGFGEIERVVDITAYDLGGTATTLAASLVDGTDVDHGLTPEGNIAIEITTTGLDLASEDADILVVMNYLVK